MNDSVNVTANNSEHGKTLEELNREKVVVLLPVIIFVILFMVIGIIGNSTVCYVYYFRMKKTPSHYFVLFLAVLDLISCTIGMPSELSDLFQPLVFSSPLACKFLRFVLSFTIISSCITLICVAFDRYYKVCKPLKGFPIRKVKLLCCVSICIGLILSWPAFVLYGTKTVHTSYPELNGKECSTSDSMKKTPFPLIYYGTLMIAFIVTFTIFIFLYVKIGVEIRHRRHMAVSRSYSSPASKVMMKKKEFTTSSILSEEESTSALSDEESRVHSTPLRKSNSLSHLKEYIVHTFRGDPESDNKNNSEIFTVKRRKKKSPFRSIRTTYIFLTVFVAFIISFVPYLIANILKFAKVAFHDIDSNTEEVVYNFCVRSYFISNFINPIIYSLLNENFRKECKKLFRRCKRYLHRK